MRVTLTIVDMENSLRRLNQNSVDFMLTDLDLAGTFLDIAETTHSDETMRRNHMNARKAYDTVLPLMEKLVLTDSERQAIVTKLNMLKSRLQAVGHEF